ncbi:hypothetical protein TWF506_004673 [Arthrobotrys conoides]|uniref:C2H2-type domain-containing protein n=1 Tax=Arthrobotrys conoides TaxID=74498 RepID=A0AAN8N9R7_9PEZI
MDAPDTCAQCFVADFFGFQPLYNLSVSEEFMEPSENFVMPNYSPFGIGHFSQRIRFLIAPTGPITPSLTAQNDPSLNDIVAQTLDDLNSMRRPSPRFPSSQYNQWTTNEAIQIRQSSATERNNDLDSVNLEELSGDEPTRLFDRQYPPEITEFAALKNVDGEGSLPFREFSGQATIPERLLHHLNETKPGEIPASNYPSSPITSSARTHSTTISHRTTLTSVSGRSFRRNYPHKRRAPSRRSSSSNASVTTPKPTCLHCSSEFANKITLRNHVRTAHEKHTHVRVQCNYEGCKVAYPGDERKAKSNIFERHQKLKHADWVRGLTVFERCTVFVPQNGCWVRQVRPDTTLA